MHFRLVEAKQIPLALLLEADPSQERIRSYLEEALRFAALNNDTVIGACIAKPISDRVIELFNISVQPDQQAKGIGSRLLKFTLAQLSEQGFRRVELGTGAFGYQLAFYQRLRFRVDSVIKDYFLDNYTEEIYEEGIQHKDMLRLYTHLQEPT